MFFSGANKLHSIKIHHRKLFRCMENYTYWEIRDLKHLFTTTSNMEECILLVDKIA